MLIAKFKYINNTLFIFDNILQKNLPCSKLLLWTQIGGMAELCAGSLFCQRLKQSRINRGQFAMSMDYDEVVLGRRSIRGYQQKPVPKN